jgi:hypothetical protein
LGSPEKPKAFGQKIEAVERIVPLRKETAMMLDHQSVDGVIANWVGACVAK